MTGRRAPLHPAVRAVAADPARAGVFLDFDGCLAPIVPHPDEARPVRGAAAVLGRLAARFRVVAIVSGRSVADLIPRVRAPGVRLLGLHGIEEHGGDGTAIAPEAAGARAAVEAAAGRLGRELATLRGVWVERKGLALAVHFRGADDPAEAEREALPAVHAAAREAGLRVLPGRRILELRPPGGGDKGDALRRIARREGLRAALACGDDVGDVPMFRAVSELPAGARVAVGSAESPSELVALADVVVADPRSLLALLRRLADGR